MGIQCEYDWTVRVRRWYGIMLNYFDHLLLLLLLFCLSLKASYYYYWAASPYCVRRCRPSSMICWLVCLSVCHSSDPCKMAEPIEMPFGTWTLVGPWKHVRWWVCATWSIPLNSPCVALIRPVVKLFWSLVMAALCNRAAITSDSLGSLVRI